MDTSPRRLTELTRTQSMRLLASVQLGRIVFTYHALPAIRPVNHIIDGNDVIVRSHPGAAIVSAANRTAGVIVAYEADAIDPATHTGWSVVVTGTARLVHNSADASHYEQVLQPWVADDMSQLIRIHADIVTGYSLATPGA